MDIGSGMGDIQQIPFQTLLHDSSVEYYDCREATVLDN